MKTFLHTLTALLIMTGQHAFAVIVEIEPHGKCEQFQSEIDQLNQDSWQKSEYALYEMRDDYDYNENPICSFTKKTEGGISLELLITDTTPIVDIDQKINLLVENILNLTRINNNYRKLCQYNGNSFYISDSEKPGFKELTLFGDLYCYSEDDLNYLKKIDFNNLLTTATKGTGFSFEINAPASPVISGTTIHN